MTEQGWEEPFIVISKVGGADVTSDTPTPIKANAGDLITLTVTIPDAYIVTNFKINGSVAPQKTSGEGENPAAYTFKVTTTSVISGTLTPKDPADLISVGDSVFDNTLNQLYIAQGVLSVAGQQGGFNSSWFFRGVGDGEDEDNEGSGEPESVFSSEVTEYMAAVPFSGYPAVISAIPTETEAGVNISSTQLEGAGVFTVTIKVTAPFWKLYPDYTPQEGDPPLPENAEPRTKAYTITVTREAGSSDNTLSSLSALETVLTNDGGVYAGTVGAAVTDLHINAVAAHSGAKVQVGFKDAATPNLQDAANSVSTIVSGLENGANSITVKVTAEDGSEPKDYIVGIYKENGASQTVYNATGGIVNTHDGYEIHMFVVDYDTPLGGQKEDALIFNTIPADGTIELLVVGGGGGGGWAEESGIRASGGGAGGFIYAPAYDISAKGTVFTVKVGAGGAKGSNNYQGKGDEGGYSAFGADFLAYGGGGGGNHGHGGSSRGNTNRNAGGDGGSGGGSNTNAVSNVKGGIAPEGITPLGNPGGATSKDYSGGSGGGAAEKGFSPTETYKGGNGGAGTQSAISGIEMWYAGGGAAGAEDGYNNELKYGAGHGNSGDANTGDGGSGGGGASGRLNGGNGGSGVVIARWPNPDIVEQSNN
jgi:hypothetical protein